MATLSNAVVTLIPVWVQFDSWEDEQTTDDGHHTYSSGYSYSDYWEGDLSFPEEKSESNTSLFEPLLHL